MSIPASQAQPGPTTASASLRPTSSPLPSARREAQRSRRTEPVTDQLIASTLTWTILELEEHLIPAQSAGDILYVYAGDVVVTHDIKRTLEVFEGDAVEAVNNIRAFVLEGILGSADATR